MIKIKSLISKFFKNILFLNMYNKDFLIIIILMIILSTLIKSNSIISKFYKKTKLSLSKNTENEIKTNKEDINLNESNEISHDLQENKENVIEIDKQNFVTETLNKNNIKINYKKKHEDKKIDSYVNNKKKLIKRYTDKNEKHDFAVEINSTICSTPIFNLKTYKDLDFHYNFLIHDFDPKKINNLIMCKDIHQWMSSSSLSNEDLGDGIIPVYFVLQKNNVLNVFEYLKLFIKTDKNGLKIAFIQSGDDYLHIKKYINELISKNLMKDLLQDKSFYNYNLTNHDDVLEFLNNLLSLVLISEDFIGDKINLDIQNYHDNKNTFEYFFNTINSEAGVFNTTI